MEVGNVLQELLDVQKELQDVQGQIKVLLDRQEKLHERQYERLSKLKSLLEDVGSPVKDGASTSREHLSGTLDWDAQADDVKFNFLRIHKYRANQRDVSANQLEIINAIMSRRDVLVIMAGGGGKSLCYLLPAILQEGVALVVSPSLSLIQDQVMGLVALGIPAHMLTLTTGKDDKEFIYEVLEKGEGKLKILYVTPEKISKSKRFMSKLGKCHRAGLLSLIAIDEEHFCSQWGHDFQPDYKKLGISKTQFPSVPMVAITATATWKVQNDLMEMLQIPECVKFVSNPNLFYMVQEKSSVAKKVVDEIAEFIQESYPNNESGIVYCFSRKECEKVAKELRDRGISADYYHADMDVNASEKVHLRWSNGKLQVIVGMVASGMEINKPDVRFVIHHSLSKSMETYYQESGRAGRDGLRSECLLYYRAADVPRLSSMVFDEKYGLQNLYDMVRYCQSKRRCRRSAFFGDVAEAVRDCNGRCDNCTLSYEIKEVDVSELVISLLQDVQEMDQTLTMLQLVDKIKTKQKELGSDLTKKQLEQLVMQLILDQVLEEEYQPTDAYVTLGPLAKKVLRGKMKIEIEVLSNQKRMNDNIEYTEHGLTTPVLEFKLDELQKELSSIHGGILPHSILTTQQKSMISARKPSSIEELERIIGKLNAEEYGSRILEAVRSTKALISLARIHYGNAKTVIIEHPRDQRQPLVLIETSEDEE